MTARSVGQESGKQETLDATRFPRASRFIEDPSAESALWEFAAAIPWAVTLAVGGCVRTMSCTANR